MGAVAISPTPELTGSVISPNSPPDCRSSAKSSASVVPPRSFVKCQTVRKTVSPLIAAPTAPERKTFAAVSDVRRPRRHTQIGVPLAAESALNDAPQAVTYTVDPAVVGRDTPTYPGNPSYVVSGGGS